MRTHKYRAWDIKKKKMIYNPFVYDDNETLAEWSMVRLNEALKDKRFVYLEYTGLCDLNSKKIFEGDIVNTKAIDRFWRNVEIKWHKKNAMFVVGKGESNYFSLDYIDDCEVIGNVYEDSHLLNK